MRGLRQLHKAVLVDLHICGLYEGTVAEVVRFRPTGGLIGPTVQTSENLIRTRECVINLPSEDQVAQVDRLALTTGRDPVPEMKRSWGYRHEPDKFGLTGFTPIESVMVGPPRIQECPIQMEGIVHEVGSFGKNGRHIDPVKWRPLIMSFCRFFGLAAELQPSRLAESDFLKMVTGASDSLATSRATAPAAG